MTVAAETWWVELRARTPLAWRHAMGSSSRSVVFDFCRTSSGLADLIFVSRVGLHVVQVLPAGDAESSERLLGAALRELLTSSADDFAREWGFPHAAALRPAAEISTLGE